MQNIIKRVVWFCLVLIPFIALYVADGGTFDLINKGTSGLYFPFISGKNFIFRFLVEIAFAGWAILALRDGNYRVNIKKSPLTIAYAIFMVILLLADIFGVDSGKSLWSNYERMEGFVGHIHMFGYFFVLTAMLTTLENWQKMFKVFLGADLLVLIYGYGQLLGAKGYIFADKFPAMTSWFSERFPIHQSENRLDATIGNSAYFAIFCFMSLSIAGLLWSQHKSSKSAWWYPVIILLNLITLFYSGTRGTMIGLVVGVLLTLGIIAWHEKGNARKILFGALVAVVIGISLLFSFKNSSFIKSSPTLNRLASISVTDLTTMSRLSIWKISYQAFLEHPILGYGQDNFDYIYARKFIPEKMYNLEPWYDRSHDVFFDWLVAAGILGLVSYLSLYIIALWLMWFKSNDMPLRERAIITGVLAGYFVHNIFVFDNLTSYVLFFALLAYIVMRTQGDSMRSKANELVTEETMNLIVAPVILIALIGVQFYVNYRPFLVNKTLIKAMSIGENSQTMPLADAIKLSQGSFEKALQLNTLGSEESREQFLQMGVKIGQVKIPPETPEDSKRAIGQATSNFIMSVQKDIDNTLPGYKEDVRMLSIFGMFYNGIGAGAMGEQVLSSAHKIAPKKQLISFDLTRSYLMENKYKEAYVLAKETYGLQPLYNDAQNWLMLSSVYNRNFKEAKLFVDSKGGEFVLNGDILNALASTKQVPLALELLNDLKKTHPEYADQVDAYIKNMLASPKK